MQRTIDELGDPADAAQLLAPHLRKVDELRAAHSVAHLADEPHRHQTRHARASVCGELGQYEGRLSQEEKGCQISFELGGRSSPYRG